MTRGSPKQTLIICAFGLVPVLWLALLIAPSVAGGLPQIVQGFAAAMNKPLNIIWCEDSVKTVLFFFAAYALSIGIYYATRRNTRPREEHGSAEWGDAAVVNRKYADKQFAENKILTQNVRIGFDAHKHRRNLNVLVCGGSGAGKTRFFCKPNAMNCNTSMVILDPKGGATRS